MTILKYYIKKGPYIIMEEDNILNSYGLCNFKLSKPFTDLTKIKVKTNLTEKVKFYKKNIKLELYYNNDKMKKIKMIGEGSFGKVYLFQYKENSIVIKIPDKEIYIDYEVDIIKYYLPKNICNDYIIPLRVITDQAKNNFVIMQEANGDLSNLKLDERLIFKIIIQVAKTLICFMKKDIIYTDLKIENILYKCKNNRISIYLADIGSFAKENDILIGGNYIPPEYHKKEEFPATKELVIFTFGCFIAELYNFINNEVVTDYPKFIKKLLKNTTIPKNIKALIILFTEPNPNKRKKNNLNLVFDLIKIK